MRKVLCLSTANYYPFPTRKQNVMNRLNDCDIIYVNPAVTYIAPLKDKTANINAYKEAPVKAKENILVYNQPAVMPFYNKKRFINSYNQKQFAKYLAGIIKDRWQGEVDCIWCYSPTVCDLIKPLAKELNVKEKDLWSKLVYDCVDRHSAYPGMIDPQVVDKMEEDLARNANVVFATADGLYERLKAFNANSYLIPNGCNFELFNKVVDMKKDIDKTIFGFVGMLQECTDFDCFIKLAEEFPDASIELIGRKLPGVDTSSLEKYSNINFVGLLPQEDLPNRIKNFDVCLNVFRNDDLSKDVSPLKFYEYLATGKAVVSTPMPKQVMDYKDCIYIANDANEFVSKCKEALLDTKDKKDLRLEYAKKCSWDERVNTMRKILSW